MAVASIQTPVQRGAGKELPIPVVVVKADGSEGIGGGDSASGLTPVSGTFAATGQSVSFTPLAGRDFNLFVAPTANTTQLERQRDGVTWEIVLTSTLIASLPPSFTWNEPQYGVPYRLNCTAYSASQAYGISQ